MREWRARDVLPMANISRGGNNGRMASSVISGGSFSSMLMMGVSDRNVGSFEENMMGILQSLHISRYLQPSLLLPSHHSLHHTTMSGDRSLKRTHDEEDLARSLKQRTYETSISKSQYERKLLAFETTKREYEITMREKNVQHAKLLKDLAWYKEKAETEQREKEAAMASSSEKKVSDVRCEYS